MQLFRYPPQDIETGNTGALPPVPMADYAIQEAESNISLPPRKARSKSRTLGDTNGGAIQ